MTAKSVPERINDFLRERPDRTYCDSCVQERLGLKWRQQVQLITATLAVTPTFRREKGFCGSCEDFKQVITAAGPPAAEPNITTGAKADSLHRLFQMPIRPHVTTSTES